MGGNINSTMGCGAGKEMLPPPSPDARVEPTNELEPKAESAWVGPESNTPEKSNAPKKVLLSSPPPADPDSVSQVQDFPGQLLQLDEAAKAGPIIPKRKGGGQTRPSSADKARPTTAGPKRDSKSRPSSAGRREASALRPAVWLEPVQARQIHEAEQSLRDVFNRPSSAGRKANHRTKSPDRSKNRPNNRPSSAERTREGDSVKNSVWLTDKSKPNVMKINCDTNQNNVVAPRPGSAGRKRSGNGLAPLRGPAVDQNGVKRPHTP